MALVGSAEAQLCLSCLFQQTSCGMLGPCSVGKADFTLGKNKCQFLFLSPCGLKVEIFPEAKKNLSGQANGNNLFCSVPYFSSEEQAGVCCYLLTFSHSWPVKQRSAGTSLSFSSAWLSLSARTAPGGAEPAVPVQAPAPAPSSARCSCEFCWVLPPRAGERTFLCLCVSQQLLLALSRGGFGGFTCYPMMQKGKRGAWQCTPLQSNWSCPSTPSPPPYH